MEKKCSEMIFKRLLITFTGINTLWVENSGYKKAFDLVSKDGNKSNRT